MSNIYYYFICIIISIVLFNIYRVIIYYKIDNICISLVIPSTDVSWKKCNRQIVNMICNSKEHPKEVIIVISGSGYEKKEYFYTYCKYVLLIYYRKTKHNSASNKNFGSKFSKCDYISYFDADDIMSKYRISIIHHIIKYYSNYDIILHLYSRNYTDLNINIASFKYIKHYFYSNSSYISYLYKRNIKNHKVELWGCCHFLPYHYHVSNGWITIKKSLYIQEKFNEDKKIQRAEDSEYNGRVISKGYKALILKLYLGYYSKQNHCNIIDKSI